MLKFFFIVAPLVGQGILQIQQAMGVNHSTVVGTIASWLIAATLSARELNKNSDQK